VTQFKSRPSQQDRDQQLEGRYTLGCGCCRSLLAHVLAHEEELSQAYRTWASSRSQRWPEHQAVVAWETDRFGAPADPAAHGRLMHVLRQEPAAEREPWLPYKE
jgi:hypothetical protein